MTNGLNAHPRVASHNTPCYGAHLFGNKICSLTTQRSHFLRSVANFSWPHLVSPANFRDVHNSTQSRVSRETFCIRHNDDKVVHLSCLVGILVFCYNSLEFCAATDSSNSSGFYRIASNLRQGRSRRTFETTAGVEFASARNRMAAASECRQSS